MDRLFLEWLRSRSLPQLLGFIVACCAGVVLLGWLVHWPLIVQVRAGWAPMQFNTALMFCGLGASVMSRRLRKPAAGLTLMLATLTVSQDIFRVPIVDDLFFTSWISDATASTGRPAPGASICFLVGAAIELARNGHNNPLAATLEVVLVFLAGSAAAGYLTMSAAWIRWGEGVTAMAAHTAVLFLILSVARIARMRGEPWVV